jgi:hypothetical protein
MRQAHKVIVRDTGISRNPAFPQGPKEAVMQTITEHAARNDAGVQRDIRKICLALVWVNGDSAPERCEEVIAALRTRPDVESAERAHGKANVIMMRFDRSCTSASDIVLELRRSGIAAVLVGC